MLCIVYISKAKTPEGSRAMPDDLSKILTVSRANNQKNGITSALVYRQGMYLHFIEGGTRNVDALYQSLSTDERHLELEKVIDIPIAERTFDDCPIKLMLNIQEDDRLVNFIAANKEMILSQDNNIFDKLEHFSSGSLSEGGVSQIDNESKMQDTPSIFVDNYFSLKQKVELDWFEIGMLEPELAIAGISLSEELINQQCSYQDLLVGNRFGDSKQLDGLLSRLNSTGSLLIEKTARHDNSSQVSGVEKSAPNTKQTSFGEKVLSWLNKDIMSYRKWVV